VREAIRGPRTVSRVWATKNAAREPWVEAARPLVVAADEIESRSGSPAHQGVCAEERIRRPSPALFLVVAIVCSLSCSGVAPVGATAAWIPSAPFGTNTLMPAGPSQDYNYGPSAIQTGSTQQFWWCGSWGGRDAIFYKSVNVNTGVWSSPSTPVLQSNTANSAAWDYQPGGGAGVCDPSVVEGAFSPPGLAGGPYPYAMYYTGAPDPTGCLNRIGVAFSHNGTTWTKYYLGDDIYSPAYTPSAGSYYAGDPYPTIGPVVGPDNASNPYQSNTAVSCLDNPYWWGAGEPTAWNMNGGSEVTLFYMDQTTGKAMSRTAQDGVSFGPPEALPQAVSNDPNQPNGDPSLVPYNSMNYGIGFAVDSSNDDLIAAAPAGVPRNWGASLPSLYGWNVPWVYASYGAETPWFGVYSMPLAQAMTGSGAWHFDYMVSADTTGEPLNLQPGVAHRSIWRPWVH